MKFTSFAAAAALALSATAASAGGLAPAMVEAEPMVVVDAPAPTSSLGQYVVPAILVGLIALGASSESESGSTE